MRPSITRVIVIGSSGSGKSTLERQVRAYALSHPEARITVPQRVVTRAPRPDDHDMRSISNKEFQKLAAQGALGLYGKKFMEGGREEWYGFESPPPGFLPIYFANNGVVKNPELVHPRGFEEDSLIVAVYAPDYVRERRLRIRSPHLFTSPYARELEFRLSEAESSEAIAEFANAVVPTHELDEVEASQYLLTLIENTRPRS